MKQDGWLPPPQPTQRTEQRTIVFDQGALRLSDLAYQGAVNELLDLMREQLIAEASDWLINTSERALTPFITHRPDPAGFPVDLRMQFLVRRAVFALDTQGAARWELHVAVDLRSGTPIASCTKYANRPLR